MKNGVGKLRHLSPDERLERIDAFWQRVENDPDLLPISDELADESERQYQEHLADPSSSIPWEIVRERLRKKYG